MARALLVGCGCCARSAGRLLVDRGWHVRGTSRSPEGTRAIEEAGLEGARADPDRVGAIISLLGDVTVLAWLLGAVQGDAGAALYEERLPSLLEKVVDTPVRGVVLEPRPGTERADAAALAAAAERWRIPALSLSADRGRPDSWAAAVAEGVAGLIASR